MKRYALIFVLALLSGCAGYSYPVKDGGDGVYYAESPPVYTYVGGYYGFSYYGPYSGYWYHPIWYSPVMGPHYSWYRPYAHCFRPYPYCGGPYYGHSYAFAGTSAEGRRNKSKANTPVASTSITYPLMPVGLEQMVITSGKTRYSQKNPTFATAGSKSRYAAKSGKSTSSYSRGSMNTYRSSSSHRASPSSRSPSLSRRSPAARYSSPRSATRDEN